MEPRILGALWAAWQAFLRSVWRAIRQMFHEITGTFFLLFALIGAAGTWREWRQGSQGWQLAVPVVFTAMMAFFAVSAFVSARRLNRSEDKK